jgi:hypothetical protein
MDIFNLPKNKLDLSASVVEQSGELHALVQRDGHGVEPDPMDVAAVCFMLIVDVSMLPKLFGDEQRHDRIRNIAGAVPDLAGPPSVAARHIVEAAQYCSLDLGYRT